MNYKIIRINKDTIELGDENHNISSYSKDCLSYNNPRVGDDVVIYKSIEDGETTIVIARGGDTGLPVQASGYYAKETSMNKHIFVWVGAFLFGCFGVDRFMRCQIALGIIKILTFGCAGIWTLIDWIIALVKCYGSAFSNTDEVTFINGSYGR